jgi:GntR family transcriptional regulator, transcriptional repressor for pyruvate dehydrogenase complex
MAIQRPTKSTLTQQATEALENLILTGYGEGRELPSQGELARMLGVSRHVVREATRTLEARGLIHAEQGKRLVVARPSADQIETVFSLLVFRDREAPQELMEVRRALETHIVRLAAQNATEADLEAIEAAIDALEDARTRDVRAQAAADGAFHDAIARATGNRFMVLLLQSLAGALMDLRVQSLRGSWQRGSIKHVLRAHREILAAIREGDADLGADAMARHLDNALKDLNRTTRRG